MADDSQSSTGETASNYLEKISPKDLVMFSPTTRKTIAKQDFNYLGTDYDLQLPDNEELDKFRVWGLPYIKLTDPAPIGIITGFVGTALFNYWKRRPAFSNIHVHLLSSLAVGVAAKITYQKMEKARLEKELVIWDYVKKHPQDFPEVFNPPKKFKDMLLPWKPVR